VKNDKPETRSAFSFAFSDKAASAFIRVHLRLTPLLFLSIVHEQKTPSLLPLRSPSPFAALRPVFTCLSYSPFTIHYSLFTIHYSPLALSRP